MISATIQKAAETISRLDALRKKMAVSAYLKKKKTAQHNRARIKERKAAERLIEKALQPFFVDQIESAAAALAAVVPAEKSTQQTLPSIFNPNDWNQKLIDTLYPAMVKIAVVGMDGEMRRMGLQIKRGFASVKSTATDFLSGLDDSGGLLDISEIETPYGMVNMAFLFEYPDWMKQAIVEFLKESFEQPYWTELNKTTLGDIEKYLQEGIKEGWSIEKMAAEMAPQLLETGRYAKIRGRNIARTEAGHALNGARSMGIDSVIAELQGTGLDIRKLWNSVLGTTTRDTHRKIHGVPADKDGTWSLGGVRCRWPGDVVLPANERCNCFPGTVAVSGSFEGVQRAWYEGVVAEIITVAGARLTATPNHPILTPDGFVHSGKMKPGQKLIAHRLNKDVEVEPDGTLSSDKVQDKPTQIQKIFEAMASAAVAVEIIRSQPDHFYGDGESLKGDIEIVRPDWELLDGSESSGFHKEGGFILEGMMDVAPIFEFGGSSSVRSFDGIDSPSSRGPSLAQPINRVGLGRISPSGALSIGIASNFDPGIHEGILQNTATDPGLLRDSLQRDSGLVFIDEVLEVRYHSFCGHVYDLESEHGVIVAADSVAPNIGIATSNCQCTLETSFGMTDEEAQELISIYEGRVAKASWANLRTKVWESTKCGGRGGKPGPCPLNKPEVKPEKHRLLSPLIVVGGPSVPQDKFVDYLEKHGQEYEAQPLPKGIKKGVMKQCYMNATRLAISNRDLTYVEGIAYTPKLPGMAIAHAWVVDKAGKVIDNTWSDPRESQYFGVPVPTTRLEMWMVKTRVYGIFGGADKASEELIESGEKP